MDVCDAATGQVITGLLNTDCTDKLYGHVEAEADILCSIIVWTCCPVRCLTFLHHANTQTLLKAAVLAAVASPLVHRTALTGQTHILGVFLHGALERENKQAYRQSASKHNQPPNI